MSFVSVPLPAFILHSRPYKETSALVDFLTPRGVCARCCAARVARRGLARPFVPLEAEFRGRGELKNVGRLEAAGIRNLLASEALFSGLYLNELLMRLLPAEVRTRIVRALRATLPPWPPGVRWSRCCAPSNGACWMSWVTVSPSTAILSDNRRADGLYRLLPDAGLERWSIAAGAVQWHRSAGHGRGRLERPGALRRPSA
jgi:DNA repair protein RecO (recombination protein O)